MATMAASAASDPTSETMVASTTRRDEGWRCAGEKSITTQDLTSRASLTRRTNHGFAILDI